MRYIIKIFLLVMLFTSCQQKANKQEVKEEEILPSDQLNILDEQVKIIGLELGSIEKKNLRSVLKTNGRLELPPERHASVTSYVGGVIKAVYVIPGTYVKKGEKLAILEHPDIVQLQQDYLRASSEFVYMEKEFQRQKELYEENVAAAKKFQLAEADYKSKFATVEFLKNKLEMIGISPEVVSRGQMVKSIIIVAPITGYVNTVSVSLGTYVNPVTEMFSILDLTHIHLILNVYEKYIDRVELGEKIRFTLAEASDKEYQAEIFKIGKSLNPVNKSVEVHAEIEHSGKDNSLLPGRYAEARIETGRSEVLALPDDAVITDGDLHYIFIKTGEVENKQNKGQKFWTFERIEIKAGLSDMGYTEVQPLKIVTTNSNNIVIKGAYYLNAQLEKKSGGE